MHLRPCRECQRHVRVEEETCPFCAATLVPGRAPSIARGRFTRAAVFAGATLLAACGGKSKPAEGPQGGGAPDAAVAEGEPDAAMAPVNDQFLPTPYGAPPARERLV